jgi:kynurenine formamidase
MCGCARSGQPSATELRGRRARTCADVQHLRRIAKDLEIVTPEIRPGDIVIVNTGWHHKYADSAEYYAYSPGFYKKAGEWFAAKGVKAVGTDTQALDHPLATAIAPHGHADA